MKARNRSLRVIGALFVATAMAIALPELPAESQTMTVTRSASGGTSQTNPQTCEPTTFYWQDSCAEKELTMNLGEEAFDFRLVGNTPEGSGSCRTGTIAVDGAELVIPDTEPEETVSGYPEIGTFRACGDGTDLTIDLTVPAGSISEGNVVVVNYPQMSAQISILGETDCAFTHGTISLSATVLEQDQTTDISLTGRAHGKGSAVFTTALDGSATTTPSGGGVPITQSLENYSFGMSVRSCAGNCTFCGSPITPWLNPDSGAPPLAVAEQAPAPTP